MNFITKFKKINKIIQNFDIVLLIFIPFFPLILQLILMIDDSFLNRKDPTWGQLYSYSFSFFTFGLTSEIRSTHIWMNIFSFIFSLIFWYGGFSWLFFDMILLNKDFQDMILIDSIIDLIL